MRIMERLAPLASQGIAMKKTLILLLLLASCRGQEAGNESANVATPGGEATGGPKASGSAGADGAPTSLTGLYEGGAAARKNQLCIIESGGEAQFGFVVWSEGLKSCLGAGKAMRSGNRITLNMAGDESCTIEARMDGDRLTLPKAIPQGCGYYCAAGASLSGAAFSKAGSSREDALKAKDIVGDPLCG